MSNFIETRGQVSTDKFIPLYVRKLGAAYYRRREPVSFKVLGQTAVVVAPVSIATFLGS
jgi:hypothetical protein